MEIESFVGKIFRKSSGGEFGEIRNLPDEIYVPDLKDSGFVPFAADSCGNYFMIKGDEIFFWDHETSELELLAKNEFEFISGLILPPGVELHEGQVKRAWINSELAYLVRKTK